MKNSPTVAVASASAIAAFAGMAKAELFVRSRGTSVFEVVSDEDYSDKIPNACGFNDDNVLYILGSNALNSNAYHFVQSQYMDAGIEVAIDEINDNCGVVINEVRYSFSYQRADDHSIASLAKDVALTHLDMTIDDDGNADTQNMPDDIAFYVAPYSTTLCTAVNPVVAKSGLASIAPGCSSPSVFKEEWNVFGVRVRATDLMTPSIEAYASLGARKVASVVEDSVFPAAVCSTVEDTVKSLPGDSDDKMSFLGETILRESTEATDEEIDTMVNKWKADEVEFVVGCTYEALCQRIIESMIKNDYNPKALAFTECVGLDSVTKAFGKKMTGITGATPFPSLGNPSEGLESVATHINTHQKFAEAYKTKTGASEVPVQAAASYAGVKLMFDAIAEQNSINGAVLATSLRTGAKKTAFGDFEFSADGMAKNKALVMQYDANMDLQVIFPEDQKSGGDAIYPRPSWASLADDTGNNAGGACDCSATSSTSEPTSAPCVPCTKPPCPTGSTDGCAEKPSAGDVKNKTGSGNGNSASGTSSKCADTPAPVDYTQAIVGSIVGGLFMATSMAIAAIFVHTFLLKKCLQQQQQPAQN